MSDPFWGVRVLSTRRRENSNFGFADPLKLAVQQSPSSCNVKVLARWVAWSFPESRKLHRCGSVWDFVLKVAVQLPLSECKTLHLSLCRPRTLLTLGTVYTAS